MPKLKTSKTISDRIKVTGRKKLYRRLGGQDHFNSKYPGKKTRLLRKVKSIAKADKQQIKKYLPYD